jgi:hypothetical protein
LLIEQANSLLKDHFTLERRRAKTLGSLLAFLAAKVGQPTRSGSGSTLGTVGHCATSQTY